MDDEQRIALVETKTVDGGESNLVPTPMIRYQLGNHLSSASLEIDGVGAVISYEEYHPYGTTAYHASRGGVDVSLKRYRFTGKERDEESGLYYHGARYYVPWVGRWTSVDPKHSSYPEWASFVYAFDNPIRFSDPEGEEPSDAEDKQNGGSSQDNIALSSEAIAGLISPPKSKKPPSRARAVLNIGFSVSLGSARQLLVSDGETRRSLARLVSANDKQFEVAEAILTGIDKELNNLGRGLVRTGNGFPNSLAIQLYGEDWETERLAKMGKENEELYEFIKEVISNPKTLETMIIIVVAEKLRETVSSMSRKQHDALVSKSKGKIYEWLGKKLTRRVIQMMILKLHEKAASTLVAVKAPKGAGVLITLLSLQGIAGKAASATDKLKRTSPLLYWKLKKKGVHMGYFLIQNYAEQLEKNLPGALNTIANKL